MAGMQRHQESLAYFKAQNAALKRKLRDLTLRLKVFTGDADDGAAAVSGSREVIQTDIDGTSMEELAIPRCKTKEF